VKMYERMGVALFSTLLAVSAYGYGDVTQHNEFYEEGTHYRVYYDENYPPRIEILLPSTSGPYWFECYEGDEPAAIRSITAASNVGNIELKVTGSGQHTYGASDVWLLQIKQEGGPEGVLEDFQIGGNYGLATAGGGTLLANRAGRVLIAGNVVAPAGVDAINLGGSMGR
jgi:hypothetical protein